MHLDLREIHDPKFIVDGTIGSYKKLENNKYKFVKKIIFFLKEKI